MKLVGLMPVRNEDWCLGFTLRVALRWCDEVIVLLHACTDDSEAIFTEIQKEHGKAIRMVLTEPLDHWDEMKHRQRLLDCARSREATHIALIDADEFLTANLQDTIRWYAANCGGGMLLELPGYNLRETDTLHTELRCLPQMTRYHANGVWGNRWFATAFGDNERANWQGHRHHHREPMGIPWRKLRPVQQGQGGTLHLWGASERRLRAKHALYKINDRLKFPDMTTAEIQKYYAWATTPTVPWTFASVKPEWIDPYADLMPYLHIDAEPWQIAEVKRLVEKHGRERFAGLDLLGVPEWSSEVKL